MSKPGIPCGQTHPDNPTGMDYCHLIREHHGPHFTVTTGTTWEDK